MKRSFWRVEYFFITSDPSDTDSALVSPSSDSGTENEDQRLQNLLCLIFTKDWPASFSHFWCGFRNFIASLPYS